MNRYDNIELSTYNPRSLQETLMVPMMRRQQHDEANKQLENQILELNKVNPLDKHYNEAQRIKSELTGTITSQAEKLATEGFNNNTTGSIFKTNRNVADMYSPTGALGQINAAKTAYEKDSDEYLKSATALGHSPEVVQQNLKAIQDEYNTSDVYDKSGKIAGMSINKLPPKYVDHVARFKDIADKAGLSSRDIENLSSRIAKTGDGGTYVLTEGGKNASSSNVAALQAAVNFLNTEIMNPNSDVGKSLKYNFKSPEDALKDIQNLAPVFVKNNVASSSSSQISSYSPASTAGDGSGANPDTASTVLKTETIGDNSETLNTYDKIGVQQNKANIVGYDQTTNAPIYGDYTKGGIFKYTDLPGKEQAVYKAKYDQLLKANRIKVAFQNPNSPQTAAFIKSELKKNPITLSTRKIQTDIKLNNSGFPSEVDAKTAKSRDESVVKGMIGGSRSILDPKTKEVISMKEFAKRYAKDGDFDNMGVKFDSQISPFNHEYLPGLNKAAGSSPDVISFKDKDGVYQTTYITKEESYLNSNNGKADQVLTDVYRDISLNTNEFRPIKHPSLKGVSIKYIPEQDAVIIRDSKGKEFEPETLDSFAKKMYSTRL